MESERHSVEKEQSYRELFERSPDAILIIEGDRFVDCNPAAVRMLRFPDKQALLERYSGETHRGALRAHPADLRRPYRRMVATPSKRRRNSWESRSSVEATPSAPKRLHAEIRRILDREQV